MLGFHLLAWLATDLVYHGWILVLALKHRWENSGKRCNNTKWDGWVGVSYRYMDIYKNGAKCRAGLVWFGLVWSSMEWNGMGWDGIECENIPGTLAPASVSEPQSN